MAAKLQACLAVSLVNIHRERSGDTIDWRFVCEETSSQQQQRSTYVEKKEEMLNFAGQNCKVHIKHCKNGWQTCRTFLLGLLKFYEMRHLRHLRFPRGRAIVNCWLGLLLTFLRPLLINLLRLFWDWYSWHTEINLMIIGLKSEWQRTLFDDNITLFQLDLDMLMLNL